MNAKKNFVLLPLKNILLKKTIENYHQPPVIKHKNRTSILYKEKNVIEEEKKKEYQENLKLFWKNLKKKKKILIIFYLMNVLSLGKKNLNWKALLKDLLINISLKNFIESKKMRYKKVNDFFYCYIIFILLNF